MHAWKACMGETPSRVQIPLSPQIFGNKLIKRSTKILLLFLSLCFSNEESFGYIHNFSGDVFLESNDEKRLVLPAISGRSIADGNIIRCIDHCYITRRNSVLHISIETNIKRHFREHRGQVVIKLFSLRYILTKVEYA